MYKQIIVFITLLLTLTSCSSYLNEELNERNIQEYGNGESYIEYNDFYNITINYPQSGVNKLDNEIKKIVNYQLSEFKMEVNKIDQDAVDETYQSELNIDYESYIVNDDIVSIKLELFKNYVFSAHPSAYVYTFNYNLKTNKFVTLDDLFEGDYLTFLSTKMKEYFTTDSTCKIYTDTEEFEEGIEPYKENFEYFVLDNDSITFYFQKYSIFPGVCGIQRYTFSFKELEQFLKIKGRKITKSDSVNEDIIVPQERTIDSNKKMIALTFDDGPHGEKTERVLDILEENNVVATFFVIGNKVATYEDLLIRMVAGGSEIGNHTWNHRYLTEMSAIEVQEQINKTQAAVHRVTGIYPKVFRPTYGKLNPNYEGGLSLPVIRWTVDSRDWEVRNSDKIINNVLNKVNDGDVILMHDIHDTSIEALDPLIKKLKMMNYQFVTVSELHEYKNIKLEAGKVYYDYKR